MKTDFVEQLQQIVVNFASLEADHNANRAAMLKRYADFDGSKYHSTTLEKHDKELAVARTTALENIAVIATEFERYLARGYQIDGSFLHPDSQLFPLLNNSELKDMAGKHNGNSTMLRALCAECERRGISKPPVILREHRQSGFDFVAKMAKAAIADARTPTRAVFVDDAVWPTAWASHKKAANVDDFAAHFDRWDSANLLKIPPQFDAA